MKYFIRLLVNALAIIIIAKLLPGVSLNSTFTAICVAFVISLLNGFVKPILVIFTLPITILTFGLFLLVINAIIISMSAYFISGFTISSLWVALFFSLLLSVLQSVLASVFGIDKK